LDDETRQKEHALPTIHVRTVVESLFAQKSWPPGKDRVKVTKTVHGAGSQGRLWLPKEGLRGDVSPVIQMVD
jgi:hypothetical protein